METTTYGPDAVHEWLEFEDPANWGDFFRVNISFMLSHYACIYGAGCPSIKADLPNEHKGCCSQGVTIREGDDLDNVIARVAQLTDAECANLDYIKEHTTPTNAGWAQNLHGRPYKTRKKDGACIFANPVPTKEGDPPMGCSFHHLANRLGVSHVETKPDICWRVPIWTDYQELPTGGDMTIITAMSTAEWGGWSYRRRGIVLDEAETMPLSVPDDRLDDALTSNALAWWCIDTPDAYGGEKSFYVSHQDELTKLMGEKAYNRLCGLLETYGERKFKMPGELVNGGQPTIIPITNLYESLRQRRDERDRNAGRTEDRGGEAGPADGTGPGGVVVVGVESRGGSEATAPGHGVQDGGHIPPVPEHGGMPDTAGETGVTE